jgi:hypothetical protein
MQGLFIITVLQIYMAETMGNGYLLDQRKNKQVLC